MPHRPRAVPTLELFVTRRVNRRFRSPTVKVCTLTLNHFPRQIATVFFSNSQGLRALAHLVENNRGDRQYDNVEAQLVTLSLILAILSCSVHPIYNSLVNTLAPSLFPAGVTLNFPTLCSPPSFGRTSKIDMSWSRQVAV